MIIAKKMKVLVMIVILMSFNIKNLAAIENKILFKINNQIITTIDIYEEIKFLKLLSGRRHKVITAIAVKNAQEIRKKSVISSVKFQNLSSHDIDYYISSGEWKGKAGGYAIQGLGSEFIPWISGSYSGVVGLPIAQTISLLKSLGWTP